MVVVFATLQLAVDKRACPMWMQIASRMATFLKVLETLKVSEAHRAMWYTSGTLEPTWRPQHALLFFSSVNKEIKSMMHKQTLLLPSAYIAMLEINNRR